MKRFNLALASTVAGAAITLSTTGFAQETEAAKPLPAKPLPAKPLNVALVVYKDMEALDLIGPMDAFVVANAITPGSYNVYTVGVEAGPIAVEHGTLSIQPRYTLANCPQPDILVVPGVPGGGVQAASANAPFIQWIEQKAADSRIVLSVCTGAFLVGKAGLLDGRKSTTHWNYLHVLQEEFPRTSVMQGVRVVEDGKLVTTASVSCGIDGALHVVEKTSSKEAADFVARVMGYRRGTPAFPDQEPGLVASSALKSPPPTEE